MTDNPNTYERHADWAELFFDLVFVLAIAEIDGGFVADPSATQALIALAFFVPVWWAWTGFAFFATRFPTESRQARLALLAASGASLVMAVGLGPAFDGDGIAFALGYGLLRVIVALLYVLHRSGGGEEAALAREYSRVFGLGALIWLVSIAVPTPWRYVLWGVAMLVDLSAPVRQRRRVAAAPVDATHLPERYGLFVMIVLGEVLAATGTSLEGAQWDFASVLTAAACFVVAGAVWWSYFDRAGTIFAEPVAARSDSGVYARNLYSYGHFPLVVGIVAMAAGSKLLIRGEHLEAGGISLALGLGLVFATMSVLQLLVVRQGSDRVALGRLLAAACCVGLALAAVLGLGGVGIALLAAAIGVAPSAWIAAKGHRRSD